MAATKKAASGQAWLDSLIDVGQRGLENLVDRATLGRDQATNIRLAEEAEYFGNLNGSGPVDIAAAKKDAAAGSPYYRNAFEGAGAALGSTTGLIVVLLVAGIAIFYATRK